MARVLPSSGGGSFGITVNLPAIPLFLPAGAAQELNRLMLATMRLALQEVAGRVSDEAPRDTGHLAQSFGADPANATGGIELTGTDASVGLTGRVFSTLPYAIVMEEGRRAGAPISRAGIDAIGLWAQRKLGLSSAQAQSAKWAIANAIIARGLQGQHYAERGFKAAQPRVERLFQILGDQITAGLTRIGGHQ